MQILTVVSERDQDTHCVMINDCVLAVVRCISTWLSHRLESHPLPQGTSGHRHAAFLLTSVFPFPYFRFRTSVSVSAFSTCPKHLYWPNCPLVANPLHLLNTFMIVKMYIEKFWQFWHCVSYCETMHWHHVTSKRLVSWIIYSYLTFQTRMKAYLAPHYFLCVHSRETYFYMALHFQFWGFLCQRIDVMSKVTLIIPSLIGPGFNSTSPARKSSMSSSRPKEAFSIPAFRRFSVDLRLSQPCFPCPNFSDSTRKSMSARRIGGKTQALVSWHNRLLKKSLLLSNTTTRVSSATKGRKWVLARVCCRVALLPFCLALNARLYSCFFFFILPFSGLKHRRRWTSGLPTVNACQRPILALHWFTSIPIFCLFLESSALYSLLCHAPF